MEETIVKLETNQGSIELKLFPNIAPKACENFVSLVKKGYYDGIIFHRVIPEFMLQCGDPTGTGRGGESIWGKAFEDECTPDVRFDKVGLLAMANAGPNTGGSQFFVTLAATPWLDGKHAIFGKVTEGMEVVRAIGKLPTTPGDRPAEEVVMQNRPSGAHPRLEITVESGVSCVPRAGLRRARGRCSTCRT